MLGTKQQNFIPLKRGQLVTWIIYCHQYTIFLFLEKNVSIVNYSLKAHSTQKSISRVHFCPTTLKKLIQKFSICGGGETPVWQLGKGNVVLVVNGLSARIILKLSTVVTGKY